MAAAMATWNNKTRSAIFSPQFSPSRFYGCSSRPCRPNIHYRSEPLLEAATPQRSCRLLLPRPETTRRGGAGRSPPLRLVQAGRKDEAKTTIYLSFIHSLIHSFENRREPAAPHRAAALSVCCWLCCLPNPSLFTSPAGGDEMRKDIDAVRPGCYKPYSFEVVGNCLLATWTKEEDSSSTPASRTTEEDSTLASL